MVLFQCFILEVLLFFCYIYKYDTLWVNLFGARVKFCSFACEYPVISTPFPEEAVFSLCWPVFFFFEIKKAIFQIEIYLTHNFMLVSGI